MDLDEPLVYWRAVRRYCLGSLPTIDDPLLSALAKAQRFWDAVEYPANHFLLDLIP